MNRPLATTILVCALALATACSDSQSDADTSLAPQSSTTSAAVTTTAPRQLTTAASSLSEIPSLDGEVGAKADATVERCVAVEGGWVGEGTVSNPTDEAVDYAVVVSFLDSSSATLGADARIIEDVEPGGQAEWSVELPVSGDDLECVLRVTRASAAG